MLKVENPPPRGEGNYHKDSVINQGVRVVKQCPPANESFSYNKRKLPDKSQKAIQRAIYGRTAANRK